MNKKEVKSFLYRYGSLIPIAIIALFFYSLIFAIAEGLGALLLNASGHSGFGYLLYLAAIITPLIVLSPLVLESSCLAVAIFASIFDLIPKSSTVAKTKIKISEIE